MNIWVCSAAKMTDGAVSPRFVPYALIGSFGLFLHLVILSTTLNAIGLNFAASQSCATFAAMLANFFLNNALTYKDMRLRGIRMVRGMFLFCAIGSMAFLANIWVATWLYRESPVWWFAGAAGALMGAFWNYSMSCRLVWLQR